MHRATTARLLALGAAAVLLVSSACSGSDDDDAGEPDAAGVETTEAPDEDAQALVFAECLRENGVDMPDPPPGQSGFIDAFHSVVDQYDQAIIQQAITACDAFFPTYMPGAHGGDSEATLALAECLREQGLDVPDNLFEDGVLRDLDEAELRSALEACRDVVGGGQ